MNSDKQEETKRKHTVRNLFDELLKVRFRHVGFAFFWAWMSLFMYNKGIFLEERYQSFDPQLPLLVLTITSALTLLVIMFFYPNKRTPLSLQLGSRILAPTLVIAGTLFRVWGDSISAFDPIIGAVAGSGIAGCGMILIMLMWGEFYGSIGAHRAALYMPLSLLCATALYYLATLVPAGVDIVLMCCYPLFAIIFLRKNQQEIAEKDAVVCKSYAKQEQKSSRCKGFLFLPWKICLAAGLYGVISGLVSSTSHITEDFSIFTQLGSILVAVLLVVGIMLFGNDTKMKGFTYKPTLLVMVAGCAALFFVGEMHGQIASAIVSSGYMLFYALSWIMYSDISYRLNLPSYKVFSSGRILGAAGYGIGMLTGFTLGKFHIAIERPEILSGLTVCLLLFTALFVLDEKDVINTWGKTPRKISPFINIASQYGLTPRETEVLELLAKGRSLPFIQEELHISYSTANSHSANIYQKMGVHSKQELISLIEQEK